MLILFFIGIIAGMIEASAGGSGLISLPALLYFGISPIQALATSKFQYAFGALASIVRFSREDLIDWKSVSPMLIVSSISGGVGAWILMSVSSEFLASFMPILLLIVAVYFLLSPRISDRPSSARISFFAFGLMIVPHIAFYDGFFGVGSASLYSMAFMMLLGLNIKKAVANTKLVDFASGITALIVLASAGHVLFLPGLLLALGQIVGAYLGASLVIRFGAALVRPVLVVVTLGLSLNLAYQHSAKIIDFWNILMRNF